MRHIVILEPRPRNQPDVAIPAFFGRAWEHVNNRSYYDHGVDLVRLADFAADGHTLTRATWARGIHWYLRSPRGAYIIWEEGETPILSL